MPLSKTNSISFSLCTARPFSSSVMYAGVALKWVWFALALYVAFARLKLEAAPLLIGMVVAQLGYWVGLIRLK